MVQDISSEQLMLQRDRLATLGILSAGLAHEINNALGYVLSNLRFLIKEMAELEKKLSCGLLWEGEARRRLAECAKVLSESLEGVENIAQLVNDMKGYARGDTGPCEWFELTEVVESSLRIVRHELKHKVSLEKHFDEHLPYVNGNAPKIQQVFVNLLMNAAQAIEEAPKPKEEAAGEGAPVPPGKVDIVLQQKDGGILVVIRDNGRGIPAECMEKVFEPFYSSKPLGKGTGLGLFICRRLVVEHGGHMHLESQVGKGTSVHVWLPLEKLRRTTEELPSL